MAKVTVLVILILFLLLCLVVLRSFTKVRKGFLEEMLLKLSGRSILPHSTWIVGGMMGSGKTTFARSLSAQLGLSHIEIDKFSSHDEILAHIEDSGSKGWVAEANPWQIPDSLFAQATIIFFLDYDNTVNYIRLLARGCQRWRSQRFSVAGFRKYIIDEIFMDLGRIVYLYGEANRKGWRERGLANLDVDTSSATFIRCVSPAELKLLSKEMIR